MDLVYSEIVFLLVSLSGDERLFDDVDEEYSFGGYKYSYYEIVIYLLLFNFF